ncbi:hypothetical protein KI387_011697 [Taxus chinensis]|uniref:Uncharacterized protein n=1 Tax=Taxus chinensis TaxID=29808 RepID=A0AA38FBL4_TAXCH|nr:hypothetical protein KI387_011697 [Taxus chinensis]
MSPFVSRGRTVAPAMSLFSESPRTAQTGQFQSPQLARTAIGWSQSPQQRNGGLSLLANAGQAHSSFTRDRRTPPSRRDRLSLLSAKEMAGNWLSLLHAPSGTQQRNGTPTRWTGNVCTLLHAGLATFSLHAPPSTRQHFQQTTSTHCSSAPRTAEPPSRIAAKKRSRHFHAGTSNKETFQTLPRGPAKTFSSRIAKMKTGQQDRLSSSRLTHSSVPLFHAHQSALLSRTGTPQAARTAQEMATCSSHDLLLL